MIGLIAFLPLDEARAAPQILAALAGDAGVPLTCVGGRCRAEISTYCLQRHRPPPAYGEVYEPATKGAFTLVVTDGRGVERRLAAVPLVRFTELRGFTAVAATIPSSVLADLDARRARIEVGAGAALIPLARPGDPDPLSRRETARAVGPLRALGTRVVDRGKDAETVRAVSAMINRLAPRQRDVAGGFERLWADVGQARLDGTRAGVEYDRCIAAFRAMRTYGLRQCLETRHDQLMRRLNVDYWDADVGS